MCGAVPVAIAAGIASVASTAAGIVVQNKQAKAQAKALRSELEFAKEENQRDASAELFESMRQARREQGRMRTQAGEAGLSLASGSVEAMLMDAAMQGELRNDRSLSNMESRHRADIGQAKSMASRISKPTALGAGLQMGSSALGAWSAVEVAKIKSGK